MAITVEITGGAVQLTGSPIWIKCSGAAAPEKSLEYKILLRVIDVDNKLLVPPSPDAEAPDNNGIAWFNISGRVDQPVKAVFQYPPAGAFVEYPSQAFSIKVQTGETYIDDDPESLTYGDPIIVWGAESDSFLLLKGGVSQRQVALWESAGSNFFNTYIADGKFLTFRPWGDFVHPAQPVKLWFIPVSNASSNFIIRCVFDDESDEIFSTPVTLDNTKLYEFNCNPAHHGINIKQVEKKVWFFDVNIEGISDTRRFQYDWTPCERPYYIFFANSIGGVDDVLLSGRGIDKFNLDNTIVERNPNRGETIYDPVLITPFNLGQNRWLINTGVKQPPQMRHLRDMLVSRQKWLLYPNQAVTYYLVIPVMTTSTELDLVDESADIHDADIEIAEAEKSNYSFDNRVN